MKRRWRDQAAIWGRLGAGFRTIGGWVDIGGDSRKCRIPSTIAYLVRQYYLAWSRPDLDPWRVSG